MSPKKYELAKILLDQNIAAPIRLGVWSKKYQDPILKLEARMLAWEKPKEYGIHRYHYCSKAADLHAWMQHQKDTSPSLLAHEKLAAQLFDDGAAFWAYVDNPVALASKPVVETMPDGAFEL